MAKHRLFRHYDSSGKIIDPNKKKTKSRNPFKGMKEDYKKWQEARKELKRLQKIVNPMINKLQTLRKKKQALSKALLDIEASGGKITLRGKNTLSRIYAEIMRAKQFLNDETATTEGAKKFNAMLNGSGDAWRIVHRLEQLDSRIKSDIQFAYEVKEEVENYLDEGEYTENEIEDITFHFYEDELDRMYEDYKRREAEYNKYKSEKWKMW